MDGTRFRRAIRTLKSPTENRLKDLYAALEQGITMQLAVRRFAHRNADADGRESHYIDIIVYDRQYTPTHSWRVTLKQVRPRCEQPVHMREYSRTPLGAELRSGTV